MTLNQLIARAALVGIYPVTRIGSFPALRFRNCIYVGFAVTHVTPEARWNRVSWDQWTEWTQWYRELSQNYRDLSADAYAEKVLSAAIKRLTLS